MNNYFNIILNLANKAFVKDEMPVAALIECEGKIIARAYNRRNHTNLTIDHAEISVITKANKKLNSWRLNNCSLYVTLEPCEMCKTTIKEARIKNVYYIVNRTDFKNQYNKLIIEKINEKEIDSVKLGNYYKNINNFWKNKRKK